MGRLPVSDNPTPALAHFQVLYDGSLNLFYEAFFSNIYRFHKVPKNHSVLTSHNILDYTKSDNLQYNMLVCWDKWLVDQVSDVPSIFFIIKLQKLNKEFWVP